MASIVEQVTYLPTYIVPRAELYNHLPMQPRGPRQPSSPVDGKHPQPRMTKGADARVTAGIAPEVVCRRAPRASSMSTSGSGREEISPPPPALLIGKSRVRVGTASCEHVLHTYLRSSPSREGNLLGPWPADPMPPSPQPVIPKHCLL